METGLKGKTVLITGASRNMGRLAAIAFARDAREHCDLHERQAGAVERRWPLSAARWARRSSREQRRCRWRVRRRVRRQGARRARDGACRAQ